MATNSNIEWTHHTFNPWRGCTKVSPGCANCYAETMSGRNPKTLGVWGPNGKRVVAAESYWKLPLKWDRAAKDAGERHRVFCASLADVFEDWQGLMVDAGGDDLQEDGLPLTMQDVRNRLFELIDRTPHLDWLLLTKRPENIAKMVPEHSPRRQCPAGVRDTYRSNVWLGVSVEDQQRADERIPILLQTPAAVRFLSIEPMLGPIQLNVLRTGDIDSTCGLTGVRSYAGFGGMPGHSHQRFSRGVDWVIVGGESGPSARPMHPDWVRSIRDQCQAAGVAFFFKQWGAWAHTPHGFQSASGAANRMFLMPDGARCDGTGKGSVTMSRVGKKAAGRLLDGREWNEFPRKGGGA